jgi:hypothetical protein
LVARAAALSTKIHMALCGLGGPLGVTLTAGQAGDAPQAADLMADLPAPVRNPITSA